MTTKSELRMLWRTVAGSAVTNFTHFIHAAALRRRTNSPQNI